MSMMSIAESMERVKGVRQGPHLDSSYLKQKSCWIQQVPFVLRRAYQNLIEDSEAENDLPFNGKEFLLSFDPAMGLEDYWVDAALFYLLNKLRNDMARRQNYGRGLPI